MTKGLVWCVRTPGGDSWPFSHIGPMYLWWGQILFIFLFFLFHNFKCKPHSLPHSSPPPSRVLAFFDVIHTVQCVHFWIIFHLFLLLVQLKNIWRTRINIKLIRISSRQNCVNCCRFVCSLKNVKKRHSSVSPPFLLCVSHLKFHYYVKQTRRSRTNESFSWKARGISGRPAGGGREPGMLFKHIRLFNTHAAQQRTFQHVF